MKKGLWLSLIVVLFLSLSVAFAQSSAVKADPDDVRSATEVKETGKKVFTIEDGKVVQTQQISGKSLTLREVRKLAEIKAARAIVEKNSAAAKLNNRSVPLTKNDLDNSSATKKRNPKNTDKK